MEKIKDFITEKNINNFVVNKLYPNFDPLRAKTKVNKIYDFIDINKENK